jgi:hypothetical protein
MPVSYWGHRTLRSSGVQSVAQRPPSAPVEIIRGFRQSLNKFRNCTHKLGRVRLLFNKYLSTVHHIV